VGVANEPQIGRLHDEHAVFVELKSGGAIEIVDEVRALVGFAVAVGVFENQNAVAGAACGGALGIARPDADPEAAFGVPIHLHGLDQLGPLFFTGEEIHFGVLGGFHLGDGFFAAEEGIFAAV